MRQKVFIKTQLAGLFNFYQTLCKPHKALVILLLAAFTTRFLRLCNAV